MLLEVERHLLVADAAAERPHEEEPAERDEHHVRHDAGDDDGGGAEAELLEAVRRGEQGAGSPAPTSTVTLRSTTFQRQRARTLPDDVAAVRRGGTSRHIRGSRLATAASMTRSSSPAARRYHQSDWRRSRSSTVDRRARRRRPRRAGRGLTLAVSSAGIERRQIRLARRPRSTATTIAARRARRPAGSRRSRLSQSGTVSRAGARARGSTARPDGASTVKAPPAAGRPPAPSRRRVRRVVRLADRVPGLRLDVAAEVLHHLVHERHEHRLERRGRSSSCRASTSTRDGAAADLPLRHAPRAVVEPREHLRRRGDQRAVAEDARRGEVAAARRAEDLEHRVAEVDEAERAAAGARTDRPARPGVPGSRSGSSSVHALRSPSSTSRPAPASHGGRQRAAGRLPTAGACR